MCKICHRIKSLSWSYLAWSLTREYERKTFQSMRQFINKTYWSMISIKRIGNIYILFVLTQSLMSNRNICWHSLNASMKHAKLMVSFIEKAEWMGCSVLKVLYLVVKNKCQVLSILLGELITDNFFLFWLLWPQTIKMPSFVVVFFSLCLVEGKCHWCYKNTILCNQKFCSLWYT